MTVRTMGERGTKDRVIELNEYSQVVWIERGAIMKMNGEKGKGQYETSYARSELRKKGDWVEGRCETHCITMDENERAPCSERKGRRGNVLDKSIKCRCTSHNSEPIRQGIDDYASDTKDSHPVWYVEIDVFLVLSGGAKESSMRTSCRSF